MLRVCGRYRISVTDMWASTLGQFSAIVDGCIEGDWLRDRATGNVGAILANANSKKGGFDLRDIIGPPPPGLSPGDDDKPTSLEEIIALQNRAQLEIEMPDFWLEVFGENAKEGEGTSD